MQSLQGAKKTSRFSFISPELCQTGETPNGGEWLHEIKLDGYRFLALIRDKRVSLLSRSKKDWTKNFPSIAQALSSFPAKNVILDGELVALDARGFSSFQLLQNAIESSQTEGLVYFVFDILHCDGYDLTRVTLEERKQFLQNLFALWKKRPNVIELTSYMAGHGSKVFQEACARGLEGIISKRRDSFYLSKRSRDWIKSKCINVQEFLICGYTSSDKAHRLFGSLLLGRYDNERLIFCGHVGTGFSEKSARDMFRLLKTRGRKKSLFQHPQVSSGVHWVKPDLVAQVKFTEWTQDGLIRHPSFLGLRNDKGAREMKKETQDISLTNPDKLLFTEPPITKRELAQFYEDISKWILPHLIRRPLTILRCPNGVDAPCFYQRHFKDSLPESIKPIVIPKEEEPYLMIQDFEGLMGLVQMGVLEIHPWGAPIKNLDRPDQMTFDIDPGEDVSWVRVRKCALELRSLLEKDGLVSFIKTTGGKGLHVVVPIKPAYSWDRVQQYTKSIASYLMEREPKAYTISMSKAERKGKIFVDYLRNVEAATAIAPYCVRARQGAPIATPLSWNELSRLKNAHTFTFNNLRIRLKRLKNDPWHNFFSLKQRLPKR